MSINSARSWIFSVYHAYLTCPAYVTLN
jgi:hypothetical protein